MSEYDLKKSEKKVGQLYPNLIAKDGRVIDGLHRLKANPKWKSLKLDHVDTDEKFWSGRILANTRRDVPYSERKDWFNQLAEVYFKQGIKPDGSIVKKVMEATGYSKWSVNNYLDSKYKMMAQSRKKVSTGVVTTPKTPIDIAKQKLGSDYHAVEEAIRKNVAVNIEADVKDKLSKDSDFIIETIEKAPMVLPTLPEPAVSREGYYKPILTRNQAEQLQTIQKKTEEELKAKRTDPKVQARARLVKAWMSFGHVLGVIDNLFCPICEKTGMDNLVWKCHPDIDLLETQKRIKLKLRG